MSSVLFTVGNDLRADDGAGPLLATLLEAQPAPDWQVVDGGDAPENCIHEVRALAPQRVLIVDAADMGLPPGTLRRIPEDCVAAHFLVNTHAIPLNFLIASLRETVAEVAFVGIQPQELAFLMPMTPAVRRGVERLHRDLLRGLVPDCYPSVGDAVVGTDLDRVMHP